MSLLYHTNRHATNVDENTRASAVALCLVFLFLVSASVLIFLFQVRNREEVAQAMTDVTKMQLLAETGLERMIGAMENQWRPNIPKSSTNAPQYYNFSQDQLNSLTEMVNQNYNLSISTDKKDSDGKITHYGSTQMQAEVTTKLIYHGGRLDPNWYGLDAKDTSPLPAVGFSPVNHPLGKEVIEGETYNYDEVTISRNKNLGLKPNTVTDTKDTNENYYNLWFTREQALSKVRTGITELKFMNNDYKSQNVFFPYTPRDALSPKTEGSTEDAPYLIVRPEGEKCRYCTDPNNASSYEKRFHEQFCEKYGGGRCVYFGGCNTFLDTTVAEYSKGILTNPEIAIKRRIPFYCLRYLQGPKSGSGLYNYARYRLPTMISFRNESAVPEYLRGMPLVECLPWFKNIVESENYGYGGKDAAGNIVYNQNLWRFWALLSNMTRYCGPSGATDYGTAIAVYDSYVEGLPTSGGTRKFAYCGLRQCPQISKIRFKIVPKVVKGVKKAFLQVDLELTNFFAQSQFWGNRYHPQWSDIKFMLNINGSGGSAFDYGGQSGDDGITWVNADGTTLGEGPSGGAKGSGFVLQKTFEKVRMVDLGITWQDGNKNAWVKVIINGISLMMDFDFLNKKYGGWGDAFMLYRDQMPAGTKDNLILTNKEDEDVLVLECVDPFANTGSDAWIIGSSSDWGKPSPSWKQTTDSWSGVLTEGSLTVNGNEIPLTAFIRGTLGGTTGPKGYVDPATEKLASHPLTLWELGCIHRAIPGKTIDLLGGDQELLEQFSLFPGDDYASFTLAKELYAKETVDLGDKTSVNLSKYLTESGKINPNVMTTSDLKGLDLLIKGLKKKSLSLTPDEVYQNAFYKPQLESVSVGANKSLTLISNFAGENFVNRGDAALAIVNHVLPTAEATTVEREEVVCKLSQLLQTRYQYFELVVKVAIVKKIADEDKQDEDLTTSCRAQYMITAVIERDAFTGKVRVINQRQGHKIPDEI